MRRMIFALALLIGFSVMNAQDKTARDFKIEGAEAYKAKDYAAALPAFEQAIKLYEADSKPDTTLYFNAGYCAYKTKDYTKASTYFDKSIELGYKKCKAKFLKVAILKKEKKSDEMLVLAEDGANTCPKMKPKFTKIIAGHHKKVALKSFNAASKKLAKTNAYAKTNPKKFKSEIVKVQQMFKKTLVLLEKAKSYKAEQSILDAIEQAQKVIATKY
jgi:tetratricopeptide (TPR) repeat protein